MQDLCESLSPIEINASRAPSGFTGACIRALADCLSPQLMYLIKYGTGALSRHGASVCVCVCVCVRLETVSVFMHV